MPLKDCQISAIYMILYTGYSNATIAFKWRIWLPAAESPISKIRKNVQNVTSNGLVNLRTIPSVANMCDLPNLV
jgi:hypothetical protein